MWRVRSHKHIHKKKKSLPFKQMLKYCCNSSNASLRNAILHIVLVLANQLEAWAVLTEKSKQSLGKLIFIFNVIISVVVSMLFFLFFFFVMTLLRSLFFYYSNITNNDVWLPADSGAVGFSHWSITIKTVMQQRFSPSVCLTSSYVHSAQIWGSKLST